MMERLFAVGEQREIFLLLAICGFVWGALQEGADAVRSRAPRLGLACDAAAALALLAMLLGVLVYTHEGVRLYGLLGVAVGALLYRAGASRMLYAAAGLMKKARRRRTSGRKKE